MKLIKDIVPFLFSIIILSFIAKLGMDNNQLRHLNETLLTDCYVPEVPDRMTFGDSVQMNITLLLSIENCNGQLGAIRKIEESRASH